MIIIRLLKIKLRHVNNAQHFILQTPLLREAKTYLNPEQN